MYTLAPNLIERGPITAIGIFMAAATASTGYFFKQLRQLAIDCAYGSPTDEGCAVDIIEVVVSALIAIGSVAGATAVGLTSPTPRGLGPLLLVDGAAVDWHPALVHDFGMYRTSASPAVVQWQHNESAPIHTYYTYSTDAGRLVFRHPTGMMMPDPTSWKRSLCEAYIDISIDGDTLRASELASTPSYDEYHGIAQNVFDTMVNRNWDSVCLAILGDDPAHDETQVDFGASCSHSVPAQRNCYGSSYNVDVSNISL